MRSMIGGALFGAAAWAASPTPLLAHGGHAGGHEGLFGVVHPIVETGVVPATVVLLALTAGAVVFLAGRWSRAGRVSVRREW